MLRFHWLTFPRSREGTGAARALSAMLLIVALSVVASHIAHARTWIVDLKGQGDFTVLQDAGDAAAEGDTILIQPGRYLEHRPFDYGALIEETYLVVKAPNVTVRGAVRDSVIIGPEVYDWASPSEPNGISTPGTGSAGLRVEDLTIENIPEGVFLFDSAEIQRITVRGCRLGIAAVAVGEIYVCDVTVLETTTGSGMSFFGNIDSLRIERCNIADRPVSLSGQKAAVVTDCEFVRGGLRIQAGTVASVLDCRFLDDSEMTATGSRATLEGNVFGPGTAPSLSVFGEAEVEGRFNRFAGVTDATLHCRDGASLSLSDCHLFTLGGQSLTVFATGYLPTQGGVLDLRGNWWGTVDPGKIAARIVDGVDNPGAAPVVMFEPFAIGPVPIAPESVGSLKSRYR